MTGLNTINGLLRLLRIKQIDPAAPYINNITKLFLVRQLNLLFNRLRTEDQLLSGEDLNKIPEGVIDKICLDRGIDLSASHRE